jgi:hypothetical protein
MAYRSPLMAGHYTQFGRIVSEWARIESALLLALMAMTGLPMADVMVLFWHTDFKHRKEHLLNLIELDHPDDALEKSVSTFSKRLESAHDIRNLVAHCGTWAKARGKNAISPFEFKAHNGIIKFTFGGLAEQVFTIKRFKTEADTMVRLNVDFRDFITHRLEPFARAARKKRQKEDREREK